MIQCVASFLYLFIKTIIFKQKVCHSLRKIDRLAGRRRCSGDDAINVGEQSAPIFSQCKIQAKKCGVKVFGESRPCLQNCILETCGEQALKSFDSSVTTVVRCECSLVCQCSLTLTALYVFQPPISHRLLSLLPFPTEFGF